MKELFARIKVRINLARIRKDIAKVDRVIDDCNRKIEALHKGISDSEFFEHEVLVLTEAKLLKTISTALDVKLSVAKSCPAGLDKPTVIDHILALFA